MAMSATTKQALWIQQLLRDIGFKKYAGSSPYCSKLYGDNQSSLTLIQNPQIHKRSKHINVAYHHVRDLVLNNRMEISYIPTGEMLADGLTKPLNKPMFESFVRGIGLRAI
jgi:hypothetical protein